MQRPHSLFLSLEGLPAEATADGPAVLRTEIFNSLRETGMNIQSIDGIECFSKVVWYVVFKTRGHREKAKNKKIKLYGMEFNLASTEVERVYYTWVRLFGYPLDSPIEFLQKTMGLYGDLVAVTDDIDSRLEIKTGIKIAQFKSIKGNIPSFILVGKYRVRTERHIGDK